MERLTKNNNLDTGNAFLEKEEVLDLIRLQKQLLIEENILFSVFECYEIWSNYSFSLSASWLFFPKEDENILPMIKSSDHFKSFEEWASIPY